jgi:hypothetical protein
MKQSCNCELCLLGKILELKIILIESAKSIYLKILDSRLDSSSDSSGVSYIVSDELVQ